jgi:putative SOS response-associated peptidase YedK
MINARAETLADKPAFRTALRRRRCLLPADGFYEWRREPDGKTKTPMYIRLKGGEPFAFAGLWDVWHAPDGSTVPSCTVVTGPPNPLVQSIHDRMPIILPRDRYEQWLDPKEQDAAAMADLLRPFPADAMEAYPVSRTVNSPKNDVAACVAPIASEGLF